MSGLFLGYLYFSIPRVIVTVMAAAAKLDAALEEAARSLGASPWQVMRDIVAAGAGAGLIAAGAMCFATSMGAFGTAFTLATDIDVLPMTIYTEFTLNANMVTAAALSIGLGLVTWLVLALARSVRRRDAWRRPDEPCATALIFCRAARRSPLLVAAFLIVPVVLSMIAGLTVNYFQACNRPDAALARRGVEAVSPTSIFLSLADRVAALGATLLIGVPAAYVLTCAAEPDVARSSKRSRAADRHARSRDRARTAADLRRLQRCSARAWLFILVGHVVFTLPFMVRAVLAVLAPIGAGRSKKAPPSSARSPWRRFCDIVVPNARARHPGRSADGGDALDRRIQPDLDAAHAAHQDAAGRACRQLRLDAARDRHRAYTHRVFHHDHAAAGAMQACSPGTRQQAGDERRRAAVTASAIRLERLRQDLLAARARWSRWTCRSRAGETWCCSGPSGCGKTTTLRIIAGLETPDAGGRVLFGDNDVTALPIERRHVGMVFQSYALFPNLTSRGNIGYGLKVARRRQPERAARVEELLAMMRHRAAEHSGASTSSPAASSQRVALARALAVQPRRAVARRAA